MTCLFFRSNTWASKHQPATIKSKHQTPQCPQQQPRSALHRSRTEIFYSHCKSLHRDVTRGQASAFYLYQLTPPHSFMLLGCLFKKGRVVVVGCPPPWRPVPQTVQPSHQYTGHWWEGGQNKRILEKSCLFMTWRRQKKNSSSTQTLVTDA